MFPKQHCAKLEYTTSPYKLLVLFNVPSPKFRAIQAQIQLCNRFLASNSSLAHSICLVLHTWITFNDLQLAIDAFCSYQSLVCIPVA